MGFLLELLPDLPYLPPLEDRLVGVPETDGGEPMSSSPLRSSEPGTIGGIGRFSRPFLTDDEEEEDDAARLVAEKEGRSLLARLLLLLLLVVVLLLVLALGLGCLV